MKTDLPTFASFYDFYDGAEFRQGQLAMYRELALDAGGPVLELGCGTGIITLELARAGLEVTGLDISPEMLDVAREKLAREEPDVGQRIRLVEADMRDFRLEATFQVVLIPNNCFGYLTELADQRSCLRAAHGHLEPGGRLIIEERRYTPEVLMGMVSRRAAPTLQAARVNPATRKYTTFHWATLHIDFATQTLRGRRFIEEIQDDAAVKRYVPADGGAVRQHYFGRFELQLLIEEAGFRIIDLWGGHDRRPPGPRDRSMVFVAEKP